VVRPSRRGIGLILGALILFLIGTNIQAGWLFVLASLMSGAVVAGLVAPFSVVRKVAVERRAPPDAHAGDNVPVDLVVTNPTRRTRVALTVRDEHIAPCTAFISSIEPGETVIAGTVRHAARRGIVDSTSVVVSSGAPFGAGKAKKSIEAPGRTVIYPRVVPISHLPELASASKPLHTATVQARKGAGHDYLGIREYQLGDSLRHVHWPSSAHHRWLMVREFEQELPRRLGVVVDTSGDTAGDETALDLCCSVAGSIVVYALSAGHPVSMTAGRQGILDHIAGSGRVEALTWLAGLRAPGGMPMADAVLQSAPLLGRLDTVVIVLPTWRANGARSLLDSLAGYARMHIVAALVEAHTFFSPAPGAQPLSPEETDELARGLAGSGMSIYRIRSDGDLALALEAPWAT